MKNNLKKITYFTVIITLVLCISACSEKTTSTDVDTASAEVNTAEKNDKPKSDTDNPKEPEAPEPDNETNNPNSQPDTDNPDDTDSAENKVASYVANNGKSLEADFESQFYDKTAMTCDCKISADGTRVVVNCNITGFNDLDETETTKIKILASSMKPTAKSIITDISNIEPEITGVDFNICEEDGDAIATVSVNK